MRLNFANLCSCRTFQRDSTEEEHLPSLKLEVGKILKKFNRLKVGLLTLDYFCFFVILISRGLLRYEFKVQWQERDNCARKTFASYLIITLESNKVIIRYEATVLRSQLSLSCHCTLNPRHFATPEACRCILALQRFLVDPVLQFVVEATHSPFCGL